MPSDRPDIPRPLRRDVLIEAGFRCAMPHCRETTVQIHHIVNWAQVHEHTFDNLIALCANCHARVTSGEIDRTAVKRIKANLSVLNHRYGDLEAIDIGALREQAVESFSVPYRVTRDGVEITFTTNPEDARAARQNLARTRRRLNDQTLRRVAEVYLEHADDAPSRAVAEVFSVDRRTARRYVQAARSGGLLPPIGGDAD